MQTHVFHRGNPAATDEQRIKQSRDRSPKLSLAELQAQLGTSANGLSQTEAQQRAARFGYNELAAEKVNPPWCGCTPWAGS